MNRKDIHIILKAYLNDECTEEQKALVDKWLALLENQEYWVSLDHQKIEEIESRIWDRLSANIEPGIITEQNTEVELKKSFLRFRNMKVIRLAASIAAIFILCFGAYYLLFKNDAPGSFVQNEVLNKISLENWKQQVNHSSLPINIVLEDGTSVMLATNAIVNYPIHFEKDIREIRLSGSAFFKVSKDPKRPFYVYSDQIITHVLGTSFWVKDEMKLNIKPQVEVLSGKVYVYETAKIKSKKELRSFSNTNGVILKPNEKVTLEKGHFITSLIDMPVVVANDSVAGNIVEPLMQEIFYFEETPLSKVITIMEQEYGINIITEDDTMNNWKFTGDISGLDYYDKLHLICKTFQTVYEVKENRILIKRK